MSEKSSDSPVRIIGSRELHQSLPRILDDLERTDVRYVLTVHGKPKAVLVGSSAYLNLARGSQNKPSSSEALVCLQLAALLGPEASVIGLDDLEDALKNS